MINKFEFEEEKMTNNIIHIFGASGAGTSTFGKYICDNLGYFFMDTDDYFWEPTNPPYIKKREKAKRVELMKMDIEQHENVVISGSLVDWGDVLAPFFTLVIRIETDTNIRIERLKKREKQHFGSRIDTGGDMYENHLEFIEWASSYDSGGLDMRSKSKHDEWQKMLKCKLIELDGNNELIYNFDIVRNFLKFRLGDKSLDATN